MIEFDPDALIDAMLPVLGLSLDDASRAAVKMNLKVAEFLSRGLRDFPLDDDAEPAPVFVA